MESNCSGLELMGQVVDRIYLLLLNAKVKHLVQKTIKTNGMEDYRFIVYFDSMGGNKFSMTYTISRVPA